MPTIEISDETYEKIKDQLSENERQTISCLNDLIGGKYFFRTVTYHLIGKVENVFGSFIELSTASWIADSGRFMNAIKDGTLDEVEPLGQAFININAVTDFFPWNNPLPIEQK